MMRNPLYILIGICLALAFAFADVTPDPGGPIRKRDFTNLLGKVAVRLQAFPDAMGALTNFYYVENYTKSTGLTNAGTVYITNDLTNVVSYEQWSVTYTNLSATNKLFATGGLLYVTNSAYPGKLSLAGVSGLTAIDRAIEQLAGAVAWVDGGMATGGDWSAWFAQSKTNWTWGGSNWSSSVQFVDDFPALTYSSAVVSAGGKCLYYYAAITNGIAPGWQQGNTNVYAVSNLTVISTNYYPAFTRTAFETNATESGTGVYNFVLARLACGVVSNYYSTNVTDGVTNLTAHNVLGWFRADDFYPTHAEVEYMLPDKWAGHVGYTITNSLSNGMTTITPPLSLVLTGCVATAYSTATVVQISSAFGIYPTLPYGVGVDTVTVENVTLNSGRSTLENNFYSLPSFGGGHAAYDYDADAWYYDSGAPFGGLENWTRDETNGTPPASSMLGMQVVFYWSNQVGRLYGPLPDIPVAGYHLGERMRALDTMKLTAATPFNAGAPMNYITTNLYFSTNVIKISTNDPGYPVWPANFPTWPGFAASTTETNGSMLLVNFNASRREDYYASHYSQTEVSPSNTTYSYASQASDLFLLSPTNAYWSAANLEYDLGSTNVHPSATVDFYLARRPIDPRTGSALLADAAATGANMMTVTNAYKFDGSTYIPLVPNTATNVGTFNLFGDVDDASRTLHKIDSSSLAAEGTNVVFAYSPTENDISAFEQDLSPAMVNASTSYTYTVVSNTITTAQSSEGIIHEADSHFSLGIVARLLITWGF